MEHALATKKSPARAAAEPARRADDAPVGVATGPRRPQPGLALGSSKVRTSQVAPGANAGLTGAAAERISVLAKIGQTKVAASAWSQGHLGGDYGITLPEELRISIDVKQAEGNWVPTGKVTCGFAPTHRWATARSSIACLSGLVIDSSAAWHGPCVS